MNDIIKNTYILLSRENFNLGNKKLWITPASWLQPSFLSIDKKRYSLLLLDKRSHNKLLIPYKLFMEDEFNV